MAWTTIYTADVNPEFRATYDNDKLGGIKEKIMAVAYVPGAETFELKNGTLVTDCVGTCGAVDCSKCGRRGECYAIRVLCQYVGAARLRIANTLDLRADVHAHFDKLRAEAIRAGVDTIRYTESGEIETPAQFWEVIKTAEDLPRVGLYLYTKNYDVLREYFATGRELPENMTVLISIWYGLGLAEWEEFKHHPGVKAFVVGTPELVADAHCPAYKKDAKGKVRRVKSDAVKCGNCKLCTRSRACKVISCEHHK